jgi:glycosyltransferase involved in cell wall biosynthesis
VRIAIFDYRVWPTNPIGGCHLHLLRGLADEQEFVVFSAALDNPRPNRIGWVRIPVPLRPLVLLFGVYHLLAPLALLAYRRRGGAPFDVRQGVESNFGLADLVYAHFCHRAYLERHWHASHPSGLRGALRWLDHWLHARIEPYVYRRARRVVVPSHGLARELATYYPSTVGKTRVVPNPIDLERLRRPTSFDRAQMRHTLGVGPTQTLLLFSALGQFERKGLPLLLDALQQLADPRVKLVVVGGEADLVASYRGRAERAGLAHQVVLAGFQPDVRPYLWAADALVLPSAYEVFSLVVFEAAAVGLPIIATPLNGVEELLRDGHNGLLIERTPDGILNGLRRFLALTPAAREQLGKCASQDARAFSPDRFVNEWRRVYSELAKDTSRA